MGRDVRLCLNSLRRRLEQLDVAEAMGAEIGHALAVIRDDICSEVSAKVAGTLECDQMGLRGVVGSTDGALVTIEHGDRTTAPRPVLAGVATRRGTEFAERIGERALDALRAGFDVSRF